MDGRKTDQSRRAWPKLSIVLTPALLTEVDRRAAAISPPSRSAAIRELIRAGLAAEGRKPARET